MTNRERIIRTALCQETDRAPFLLYLGAWDETLEKWEKEEGFSPETDLVQVLGYDPGIKAANEVALGLLPAFPVEVIEDKGDSVIVRNDFGVLQEQMKGHETIPRSISYPVSDMEDWQKLKAERLDPHTPERFPKNWKSICECYNNADVAIQIGDFPFGLFGTLRELMGVENLLVSFYDQPELIHDMMDYLTDFWLTIYEKMVADLKVDCIHIWEDMSGKHGPLISPDMIREFMLPNYKKIRRFADEHNIPFLMLDTDGNCDSLIPLFLEGGINLLIPFEVAAGSDVVRYRQEYANLAMLGGIDKRELAKDRAAIDKELARIEPMLKDVGYFPALDHLIHPEITWADFCYYSERLKEMILSARDN